LGRQVLRLGRLEAQGLRFYAPCNETGDRCERDASPQRHGSEADRHLEALWRLNLGAENQYQRTRYDGGCGLNQHCFRKPFAEFPNHPQRSRQRARSD
jgi:hypothetical protein